MVRLSVRGTRLCYRVISHFGSAFCNSITPDPVTFVPTRLSWVRCSRAASSFSPTSVTPVQERSSEARLFNEAGSFRPASVTPVLPRKSAVRGCPRSPVWPCETLPKQGVFGAYGTASYLGMVPSDRRTQFPGSLPANPSGIRSLSRPKNPVPTDHHKPTNTYRSFSTPHTFTVLSPLPLAMRLPSGLQHTLDT